MIAGHIEDLIHVAKAMPNGMRRNKIISHLEDARAHAMAMEREAIPRDETKPPTKAEALARHMDQLDNLRCTCPEGAVLATCPIHGNQLP